MSENFKFSTVFHTHVTPAGERAYWVPSDEAWGEIGRLENVIAALEQDYKTSCEFGNAWEREYAKQRDRVNCLQRQLELNSESHDKLIALQTQVMALIAVSVLHRDGKATIEQLVKVFAELQRLAVE